ncbi:MAG: CDP-alcohol phosphatidyltransferase family protein, partial [Candidatus Latescibacteria bacterium]|nr:CDP-alcohol phosphatidyltransferase family protein [Candidatus Latescibacterota bacterium]
RNRLSAGRRNHIIHSSPTRPRNAAITWLMLANILSGLRVLLIPFLFYFIAQGEAARLATVLLLLFAAATDLGDGLVARRYGQISRLGKVLDPLADKIFLACLLGALVYWRDLPLWLLGMLLVRDAVIVLVSLWLLRARGLVVAANHWGKYTTATMGFMSLSYVLQAPDMVRDLLVAAAAAMVLVSSASYARLVRGILREGESAE